MAVAVCSTRGKEEQYLQGILQGVHMYLSRGRKIFSMVVSSHTQQACRSQYAVEIFKCILEQ